MNFTRRRGAIALFIALGALLLGVTVTLNIGWIILNQRRAALLVLGIICFAVLIAGVVLNTVFLLREIRRNERQDSFLNAVTHELKTPIASIRLYLETLQRRPVDEAQRQEFYTIMLADSDRLLATVEQVLKAGQLGQRHRQLHRTLIDIEQLLNECIAITSQRHHLPPGTIVLDPGPAKESLHVLGLAEDLRTALLNVLDNAVKYSADVSQGSSLHGASLEGAPLEGASLEGASLDGDSLQGASLQGYGPNAERVRCSISVDRPGTVVVRIADHGLGLPPGYERRIFKRFYRVPGRAMVRIKGTGLGLFLVRAILRQHGGDATAHSPGLTQGTTITLALPLANGAAAHSIVSPATTL